MATGALVVGLLIFKFMPQYSARLLQTWSSSGPPSSLARPLYRSVLYRILAEYYSRNTSTQRREDLKIMAMGNDGGVTWAKQYANRGFPEENSLPPSMFGMLEERLSRGGIKNVHQVACGSGREVAYFARQHQSVKFIGSDGDPMVVEFITSLWENINNLSFSVTRLDRLNQEELESLKCDLVYASGGLQYLDEPSLKQFCKKLSLLTPRFLLAQPISADYDGKSDMHSSRRGTFSWNHPYVRYLADEGWTVVNYEFNSWDSSPWAKTISLSAEIGPSSQK